MVCLITASTEVGIWNSFVWAIRIQDVFRMTEKFSACFFVWIDVAENRREIQSILQVQTYKRFTFKAKNKCTEADLIIIIWK